MKKGVLLFLLLLIPSIAFAGELEVTQEHPFLVNNEWIPAKQLEVGNLIQTYDGKLARITYIEQLVENISVYNLEDSYFHNYAVTDDKLVVHNSGGITAAQMTNRVSRTTVNIEVTGRCNAVCTTCPRTGFPHENMDLSTFRSILARIADDMSSGQRVVAISLAGRGEPTIHPQFLEFIAEIAKFKAEHPGTTVKFTMVTNGQALDATKINAIIGVLDELKISFGSYTYYNNIHRGLNRESVLANLQYLANELARRGDNMKISFHMTPTEYTPGDLAKTAEVLAGIFGRERVKFVVFPFTANRAGSLTGAPVLDPNELLIQNAVRNMLRKGYDFTRLEGEFPQPHPLNFWTALWGKLCLNKDIALPIRANGNYGYCINDWCGKLDGFGNVDSMTIQEALASRLAYEKNNGLAEFCSQCNVLPELTGKPLLQKTWNQMLNNLFKKMGVFNSNTENCQ